MDRTTQDRHVGQEELRELLEQQRKAAEYLQKLAGQLLTYEQQQREKAAAQSQTLDRHIAALAHHAQALAGSGQRLVSDTVKGVEAGTHGAIAAAAQSQFQTLQEAAKRFAASANEAGAAVQSQRAALESVRQSLLWKLSMPLAIGAVLCALGGGAWLWFAAGKAKEARQQATQARMQAEMVHAMNAADIRLCGEKLCVNVDRGSKQVIAGRTYYIAAPR